MIPYFTFEILMTGMVVFLARVVDVSLGTLRTINIVKGRIWMAFWIGIIEISIWLAVMSTVILKIQTNPILGIFFAFGFAFGNVAGILIERWLAFGDIVLRVICREQSKLMAQTIRQAGFGVTTFQGEGMRGPVVELYIICRRRDQKMLVDLVHKIDPKAFYIVDQSGQTNHPYRPVMRPTVVRPGGWRNILKKK